MPGFYLAALAAVATFDRNDLDRLLPEPTPTIKAIIKGEHVKIKLTRRRMLCYLFGYLTFLSLMIYLFLYIGLVCSPSAPLLFKNYLLPVKVCFVLALNLFFYQMIAVTVFGLYQLCDRIHQPDYTPPSTKS